MIKVMRLPGSVLRLAATILMLAGCGGSQGQVAGTASMPQAWTRHTSGGGYIYVTSESRNNVGPEILVFSDGANGNVAPVNVITGSQTQLSQINGIAVDASGEIYVANTDSDDIVGFAPGSSGNVHLTS
jgi:hypothetical protein